MSQNGEAAAPGLPEKEADVAVRVRLLTAALELFMTKGYAATTVREIVESAGVTKPVLYYYFRNKEGIYLELMGKAFEEYEALMGRILGGGGSARERLVRLAVSLYDLALEHIGVMRLMYAIYYGPPQGAPHFDFDEVHRRYQDAVLRLVREGIAAGEFRREQPEDVMWALIGVLNVAIEVELCHPEERLRGEGIERILSLILDGLAYEGNGGDKE